MKSIIAICMIVSTLTVFAHGGEDHSAPAQTPSVGVATGLAGGGTLLELVSYPGNLEVFVKYPAPKLNEPVTGRIFFADFASNHPVNPVSIELTFPESSVARITKQPQRISDGVYEFVAVFTTDTSHTALAKIVVDSTELLTTLSPFYSGSSAFRMLQPHDATADATPSAPSLSTWLIIGAVPLAALVVFVLLWLIRKRRRHVSTAMLAIISLGSVVGILAHGGEDHAAPSTSGNAVADATSVGHIVITKESQFALGMLTEQIAERTLAQSRRVTGKIVASPNALAEVYAPQPGRIKSARAWQIGDVVARGQLLFYIEQTMTGSERLDLERALIEAERELEEATRDYNRKLSLEGVVAKKDIEFAHIRMQSAKDRQGALKKGLSQGTRPIAVVSPISGTISNSDLTNGENVDVNRQLLVIVNTSTVWIEAQLFESDLAMLPDRAVGIITSQSSPTIYSATLKTVGNVINPSSRTAPVIFEVKNPDGKLKINSTANVEIGMGADVVGIAVTKEAIIESGSDAFVIVHRSPEAFEAVKITRGLGSNRTHVQVVEGLRVGDKVVVTGLTHFRNALPH